ncbi:MAG: hypothetical protein PHU95_01905 [Candidatus Thermoplasmatota archaeon]|nr:hypothetical protein [Candidatus Thermoplasmatota archaeon]MDD5778185.1 hypothetical protein [Candidatus Thermoplasmatota archaeon]
MPKDRGKTQTIKDRTVYVYAPTLETVERWKQAADKAGLSLSKFFIECVEDAIREDEDYQPRVDLLKEVEALRGENNELKKRVKMLDALVEKQERELKQLMSRFFVEEKEGIRQYDRDLVDLLRTRKQVSFDDIVVHLDLDRRDTDVMRAVNQQLDHLEAYGLIVPVREGYKWNE